MAETIAIDVVARLDDLKAQLATIPRETGEAGKLAAAELNKNFKKLEAELKKAGKGAADVKKPLKEAADTASKFGDQAGKLGENAGKLAGVLDLIAPGAGAAATSIADLADAGEVASASAGGLGVSIGAVGVALGAVAVAAGVGYVAYQSLNEESDRTTKLADQQKAMYAALQPMMDDTRMTVVQLAGATGELTDAQVKNYEIGVKALNDWTKAQEATSARLKEIRAQQQSFGQVLVDTAVAVTKGTLLEGVTDALTTSSEELDRERQTLTAGQVESTKVLKENADAHKELAKQTAKNAAADKAAAKEKERLNEALRRQSDWLQALNDISSQNADDYSASLEGLAGLEKGYAESVMDERGKLEAWKSEQFEAIAEQEAAGLRAAGQNQAAREEIERQGAEVRVALAKDYSKRLGDIDADAAKQSADAAKQSAEAAAKAQEEYRRNVLGVADQAATQLSAVADTARESMDAYLSHADALEARLLESGEYLTDAQKDELEKRVKLAREAAQKQFKIAKALDMASAITSGGSAFVEALASGPPPFNFINAGLVAASSAAQIATIAGTQPSFHTGRAPDEIPATILRDEAVLSRQGVAAAGGADAIRDLNAGKGGSGGAVYAITVYRNDAMTDRWRGDGLKAGDSVSKRFASIKSAGRN